METQARPLLSITHPLWGLSLAVLLVNDHLLKGAGIVPPWLTGKLSDLAGYFMFPSLLAVLLRVRSRRGLLLCHLGTAALLLLTELSPGFCRLLLDVFGHRLWPDPTDLVALFSIVLSWRVLAPLALRTRPQSASPRQQAMVTVGALACIATAPQRPEPEPYIPPAEMYVQNGRGQALQVRASVPQRSVVFACQDVLTRPHELFQQSQFVVARHLTLDAGRMMALDGLMLPSDPNLAAPAAWDDCNVVLLQVEGSTPALVVWRSGSFGVTDFSQGLLNGTGVTVQADGRLTSGASVLFAAPPAESVPTPASAACRATDRASQPTWSASLPAVGNWRITDLVHGADGCDALTLVQAATVQTFTVCAEPVVLPFGIGDTVQFRTTADGSNGLVMDGSTGGVATTLTLVQDMTGFLTTQIDGGCMPAIDRCGAGVQVRVQVPTLMGPTRPLARGEQQTLLSGTRSTQVYVSRAEEVKVRISDQVCGEGSTLGAVVSYITVSVR